MILTDQELERYARHIVLREIGGEGQARLKEASVLVVGAGGIGSPVIEYLAAAGIGRLTLVDDDRVDLSNLQRQTLFATADVGLPKVEAASARARALNPHVTIVARERRIDAANAPELIAGHDVVVDGCDNFATRLAVADACHAARIPLVSAAVGQFDGQLAVYRGWDPDKPCYRCLVGGDPGRAEESCAEAGVIGALAGAIGSLGALEVIRAIHPFGDDPAGKLLLLDALGWRFRTLIVSKDPGCPTCGG